MQEKYKNAGLNYDIIISKYPNIQEYEETLNAYLDDPFFYDLKKYLEDGDYELSKDALKGLFILAQELCLFPLYMALMEIYEDIEAEDENPIMGHYEEMIKIHKKIRGAFVC